MDRLERIRNKVMSPEILRKNVAVWRFLGKKIVFTNGCFDILHLGHIDYLAKAADLGDILVLGLNSDASVYRLKGKGRPITGENSRAMVMASLSFVSAVVLFEEDTPFNLINMVKPDILVKGGDYHPEEVVGAGIVQSIGGKVVILPFIPGYSTTAIEEKILMSGNKQE
ncbi:MAG: D-glycero-beta-D-manno-heptose 1-phosphate adenylyltransferase [Bacteroidetes bacterium]|nr:D-glycero-beta-D-manno-heptose 1-phosphate adenylyltransferase [Bacteroidota bacterium]